MEFSKRLLLYRAKNKLTQEKLAKLIGVRKETVYKWENEYTKPSKQFVLLFDEIEKGE